MFNDVAENTSETRFSKGMIKFLKSIDSGLTCDDETENIFPVYMGKWCSLVGADACLEFLDFYFTYCVKWAPHGIH